MDGVRFGCGAIVGAILGAWLLNSLFDFSIMVIAVVVVAVIFGLLAARYGDRFWQRLVNWLPWI